MLLLQSVSFASNVKVMTVVRYSSKDVSPSVSAVWSNEVAGMINAKLLKHGIEADTVGSAWEAFAKNLDKETLSKAETYLNWQKNLTENYDTILNVTIDKYMEKEGFAAVSARISLQRAEANMSALSSNSSSRMVKGSRKEVLKQVLDELSDNVIYMLAD